MHLLKSLCWMCVLGVYVRAQYWFASRHQEHGEHRFCLNLTDPCWDFWNETADGLFFGSVFSEMHRQVSEFSIFSWACRGILSNVSLNLRSYHGASPSMSWIPLHTGCRLCPILRMHLSLCELSQKYEIYFSKMLEKKNLFNILDAVVQNLLHRAWYCFSVSELLSGCCFILSESKYFWYWMSRLSVSSLYRRLLVSNFSGRFWWYFWMLYKRFQQNVSIFTNKQKNARKQHAAYSHTLHGNVPPLILEIMIPSGLSTLILTTTG